MLFSLEIVYSAPSTRIKDTSQRRGSLPSEPCLDIEEDLALKNLLDEGIREPLPGSGETSRTLLGAGVLSSQKTLSQRRISNNTHVMRVTEGRNLEDREEEGLIHRPQCSE